LLYSFDDDWLLLTFQKLLLLVANLSHFFFMHMLSSY
jgi:hypothetical protein